jgi:predicted lipoprotein with Yx(FWY)xxD motif
LRGFLTVALVAVVSGTLAGCGASSAAQNSDVVQVGHFPGAGDVLSDGAGYALYVYLPDRQGSPRCKSVCAKQWPPLLLPSGASRPTAGTGVNPALLGTVRSSNGSLQITYDRWPLYTYHDDPPGRATGQGQGMGAWYLLEPNGEVDRQAVVLPSD